jgi:hypothetical protein
MKKIVLGTLIISSFGVNAQTPALDKAKEDSATAAAMKASYEAQKASYEAQKAAYEAQAAAAEAKAKSDLSTATAEANLLKAIAEQQKASSDANVASQTVDSKVTVQSAEALSKQGEAFSKLFPTFDSSKIRAPTPGTAEFKSQQLMLGSYDAQCLAKDIWARIEADLGRGCVGKSNAVLILDAPAQRQGIRIYNLTETQVLGISRKLNAAIARADTPGMGGSIGSTGLAGAAGIGAVVQLAGSLGSLMSAVKSVYTSTNSTSSGFDESLKSSLAGLIAHSNLTVKNTETSNTVIPVSLVDPKFALPRIGVTKNVAGIVVPNSGLLGDIDIMLGLQEKAASKLELKKTKLAKIIASEATQGRTQKNNPKTGTNSKEKEELQVVILLLESAIKESADVASFLLREDPKFGGQAPINVILDVRNLSDVISTQSCVAALSISGSLHFVDTRAQDSSLQFHQRVYLASAGVVNWQVWNTQNGQLLSGGTAVTSHPWSRGDEKKYNVEETNVRTALSCEANEANRH